MKYTWIDEYLMSKPSVTKDLKAEWNWIRYMIGGKMFAAVLLNGKNEPYYINLKLIPEEGAFLRKQYSDIIPGYYASKLHWNSIKPDGDVPDELMKVMLDKSYALVLHSLSRKKQRELLISTFCGLDCTSCRWKEPCGCQGCTATEGFAFHCTNEPCPIAKCAKDKGVLYCGDCKSFPCKMLSDYSCDPEHGDNPVGARIEACRNYHELLKKQLPPSTAAQLWIAEQTKR